MGVILTVLYSELGAEEEPEQEQVHEEEAHEEEAQEEAREDLAGP